ncbi:MAG: hypothetical protein V1755_06695 [Chloroflexota bacterium]
MSYLGTALPKSRKVTWSSKGEVPVNANSEPGLVWTTPGQAATRGGAEYKASKNKGSSQYTAAGGYTQNQLLQQIMDEQQKAYDEAKAANEKRYQELLAGAQGTEDELAAMGKGIQGGYTDRYNIGMGFVNQMGEGERARIERDRLSGLGRADAAAASRGFYNSTVALGNQALVDREASQQRLDLEDKLLSQKLSSHTGLSGDTLGYLERFSNAQAALGTNTLGYMERRTDDYQDNAAALDRLYRLAEAQGQGGGGGGGGVGYASPAQFGYNIPGAAYGMGLGYGSSYGGGQQGPTQGKDYSDPKTWTPQMKQQIQWMRAQGYTEAQINAYIKGEVRFDQLRPPA